MSTTRAYCEALDIIAPTPSEPDARCAFLLEKLREAIEARIEIEATCEDAEIDSARITSARVTALESELASAQALIADQRREIERLRALDANKPTSTRKRRNPGAK